MNEKLEELEEKEEQQFEEYKYQINEESQGNRIDKEISKLNEDISREIAQKLINDELILVNGNKTKASYKVKLDDEIIVKIPEPEELEAIPEDIPIKVLYEDNDIIVVNKKKGMVVHPANGNYTGTLVNALLYYCKNSLSGIGGKIRPGIVHRLDKNTSGVIIVAKNDKAHISLTEQIKNHQVKKTYIALVRGIVPNDYGTIDMPIARSKKDRKKMAVDKNGKNAITHFEVLKRYENNRNGEKYTLLKINIETGRTHQIRVHMSYIGYPIIGDDVYSNGKNKFGVTGQMLHAKTIKFKHPTTGKEMEITAELPKYFEDILRNLDND